MAERPDAPSVLLVLTDHQRRDTLSAYGNRWIDTPALARLARDAFVLDNTYVTQPVCSPSRSSLLTGFYPHNTGVTRNNIPLADRFASLAELVPPSYRRAYFGKWHLGDDVHAQHGFADWTHIEDHRTQIYSTPSLRGQLSDYHRHLVSLGYEPAEIASPTLPWDRQHWPTHLRDQPFEETLIFGSRQMAALPLEHSPAMFVADRVKAFLAGIGRAPFVLVASLLEPHPPYHRALDGRYDAANLPVGPAFMVPPTSSLFDRLRSRLAMASVVEGDDLSTERGWRNLRAGYFSNMSFVDSALSRILDALEEVGVADRTIVIQTSDHGEMAGDHGLYSIRSFYEEVARVPLVMRVPWYAEAAAFVPGNFSLVDLPATVLDLLGLPRPERMDGRSFLPRMIAATENASEDAFIEWNGLGDRDLAALGGGSSARNDPALENVNFVASMPRRTIVSRERWKLTLCAGDDGALFDLNEDPYELHNLFDDPRWRDRKLQLAARIWYWQQRTGDQAALPTL